MKSLHILFIDFDDIHNPLLAAGQAKSTFEVGKRLVTKGHNVTVITSKYPGSKDRTERGIHYRHIGFGSRNLYINTIAFIFSIPFILRRIQADVIIECFTAPISTLLSPLWTKTPVIAKPTSFEAERFTKQYRLPFYLIEKYGCKLYQYFIPANKTHDVKMKTYNPSITSCLVPEGVDEVYFTIQKREPKYILYLGRLDIGQKGIDLLIRAYAAIANKIPYPLVIAGHGNDESKVRILINKYKLEGRVQLIGPTYGKKKLKIMSEALYVVLPSRHEGFSIFSLEALAAGLPLVTFDIPELSWQKKSVALKARAFDIETYAQLLKYATNQTVLDKISVKTKKFAEHYTWEITTNQYELFINKVLTIHSLKDRKKKSFSLPLRYKTA